MSRSFAGWNEPLITPRGKLAGIIAFARRGRAKLIFLDIELTRFQDGTPFTESSSDNRPVAKTCKQLRPGDRELCDVVTQPGETPIILARTIELGP